MKYPQAQITPIECERQTAALQVRIDLINKQVELNAIDPIYKVLDKLNTVIALLTTLQPPETVTNLRLTDATTNMGE